jgi:hypothetical protein
MAFGLGSDSKLAVPLLEGGKMQINFAANESLLRPARVRLCELRHRQLLVLRLL